MKKQELLSFPQILSDRISWSQRVAILSVLVAAGAAAVGFAGIYTPWQQKRAELESRYGVEKNRLELLAAIQRHSERIGELERRLLLEGGESVLTDRVSRLADQSGVQIESVTPQPSVPFDPYQEYQIQVVATATFADLLKFFHLLEDQDSLLKVDRLEMGDTPSTAYTPPSFYRTSEPNRSAADALNAERFKVKLLLGTFGRSPANR